MVRVAFGGEKKFDGDVNVRLLSAVLMFAMVPVKTICASLVPSPVVNDRPAIPPRLNVPFTAVSVTFTSAVPASGSEIEIWFPPVKTSGTSSFAACAPGTVLTGARFAKFDDPMWFKALPAKLAGSVSEALPSVQFGAAPPSTPLDTQSAAVEPV